MKKCDLLITGKYILPMDDQFSVHENAGIAARGNKIMAMAPANEIIKAWRPVETIDAGNSIIIPGMINAHTHATMAYFRGLADDLPLREWLEKRIWPAEAKYVNPEFVRSSSELACLEMLEAGVTGFNDMYFFADITARVVKQAGMRAYLGEVVINFPTPSAKNPDEAIERTNDLIKEYEKHEYIRIVFNPHSIYTLDKKYLIKIRDLAEKYRLPAHIHISETKEEVENSLK